jgi:hypothetical protein
MLSLDLVFRAADTQCWLGRIPSLEIQGNVDLMRQVLSLITRSPLGFPHSFGVCHDGTPASTSGQEPSSSCQVIADKTVVLSVENVVRLEAVLDYTLPSRGALSLFSGGRK